jgi:hypothetical protein
LVVEATSAGFTHPLTKVIAEAFAEAERRGPGHDRAWCALVDGNNAQIDAINAEAAVYDVTIPILVTVSILVEGACRWSKTACTSPAPAGARTTPKPSSSSAPLPATATLATTSPTTSNKRNTVTTPTSTNKSQPDHLTHRIPIRNESP